MLSSSLTASLSLLADRAIWLLTGRWPEQPRFDGLLDDLFWIWPPEPDERPEASLVQAA